VTNPWPRSGKQFCSRLVAIDHRNELVVNQRLRDQFDSDIEVEGMVGDVCICSETARLA